MSMISRETGMTHARYLDIVTSALLIGTGRGDVFVFGDKDHTVGERIRLKRKSMGLSQEELAERMHVTAALISNYENDKVDIKSSVMRELAEHLGTTVAYLIDGDPEIDTDIKNLISVYLMLGRPNVQKVALEQMKILNGV